MKLKLVAATLLWSTSSLVSAVSLEQTVSLLQRGEAEQALQAANQQLQSDPAAVDWQFLKARSLAALDKLEQAEQQYRELIAQHPRQIAAYNNLAAILVQQGRMNEAGQILEQALIRTDPAYATVYENLQSVNVEIARASYGKALRVEVPDHKIALKALPMITPAGRVTRVATVETSSPPAGRDQPKLAIQATESTPPNKLPRVRIEPAQDAVEATVQGWAAAWAAQDVDLYLSFYASDFQPDDGLSRQEWASQRRLRLTQPSWIKVELGKLRVTGQNDQQAVVEFTQEYRSDTYSDVTHKQLVLDRVGDGWRIRQENSL